MTLRAHFDGHVLVPEGPVDLPVGRPLEIEVRQIEAGDADGGGAELTGVEEFPLMKLVEIAYQFPPNPDSPTDGAAQHDHYLYGAPKRP